MSFLRVVNSIQHAMGNFLSEIPRDLFPRVIRVFSIMAPTISQTTVEDHSGGGLTDSHSMAAVMPTMAMSTADDSSGGGFTSTPALSLGMISRSLYPHLSQERCVAGEDGVSIIYGANWMAQTFTPTNNHNCNIVWLRMSKTGTLGLGTLTASLRATAAGLPTGADLVSGTFDPNYLDALPNWFPIIVSSQALVASTVYAIVVRISSGDISDFVSLSHDGTSPSYAGGSKCHSTDSGSTWSADSGTELLFEEGEYTS